VQIDKKREDQDDPPSMINETHMYDTCCSRHEGINLLETTGYFI